MMVSGLRSPGLRPAIDGARAVAFVALFPLVVLGPVLADETKRADEATESAAFRTVDEIVHSLEPWVVAIRVERSKDLDAPGESRRLAPEARGYFERPDDAVTGLLVSSRGDIVTSAYNVAGDLVKIVVVLPDGRNAARPESRSRRSMTSRFSAWRARSPRSRPVRGPTFRGTKATCGRARSSSQSDALPIRID